MGKSRASKFDANVLDIMAYIQFSGGIIHSREFPGIPGNGNPIPDSRELKNPVGNGFPSSAPFIPQSIRIIEIQLADSERRASRT